MLLNLYVTEMSCRLLQLANDTGGSINGTTHNDLEIIKSAFSISGFYIKSEHSLPNTEHFRNYTLQNKPVA